MDTTIKINGQAIPAPRAYRHDIQNVHTEAERTLNSRMHLAGHTKLHTLAIEYEYLTPSQLQSLYALLYQDTATDGVVSTIELYNAFTNKRETVRMYLAKQIGYDVTTESKAMGCYADVTVELIEM